MTSTTERPVAPWPTRREREGGPERRPEPATWTALAERPAAYVPRHAAVEPTVVGPTAAAGFRAVAEPLADVTERLPIVIPAQRSADAGPASASVAPVVAGLPPSASTVAAVAPAPTTVTPPHPAPWRPTHTPCPPRPAVGSAVHDVRPATGPAGGTRNGLGVAAVCLGVIGLPFGLVPVTGFLAAGLGVLALVFGIAGWSRVRARTASNRGAAVTGAVLGLVALGLGVAGTVAFVRAPDRLTYDLNSISTSWSGATAVTPAGE